MPVLTDMSEFDLMVDLFDQASPGGGTALEYHLRDYFTTNNWCGKLLECGKCGKLTLQTIKGTLDKLMLPSHFPNKSIRCDSKSAILTLSDYMHAGKW